MASTLEISVARKGFNAIDERLKRDRVIYVRRRRRRVFALIDLTFLEAAQAMIYVLADPQRRELVERAMEDIRAGKPGPGDEESEL